MFIFYIIVTLICCGVTFYLVEKHIATTLKTRDEQYYELFKQLGDNIVENKKQIQKNIQVTNQLTNKVFYNK